MEKYTFDKSIIINNFLISGLKILNNNYNLMLIIKHFFDIEIKFKFVFV
jgi:hypothetical protein